MINNVVIKNVASFGAKGADILNLRKLNFIFGFNGTGKSTIAKYLYNITLPNEKQSLEYKDCSQDGYNETNNKILVYNEEFVKRNFITSSELEGIFSLDETNEEIDQQIESKENNLKKETTYQQNRNQLKNNINKKIQGLEKDLCDFCFAERRSFDSFSKIQLKHSGNKRNHLAELRKFVKDDDSSVLTLEVLQRDYDTLYVQDIKSIDTKIEARKYKEIRYLENELSSILSEIIVGNNDVDIARMIDTLNIGSWVSKGVEFIKDTNGVCPFCQKKTIDTELMEKFNRYFDTTYKEKLRAIQMQFDSYNNMVQEFIRDLRKIETEFNPNNILSLCLNEIEKNHEENKKIVDEKLKAPNERKSLKSIAMMKQRFSQINIKIKENNERFESIDSERNKLISKIWTYMAHECRDRIVEYDKKKNQCDRINNLIDTLVERSIQQSQSLKSEIEQLRTQTQDTKAAVDNINSILKNTGFSGFSIIEKYKINNISKYKLVRANGENPMSVFDTLSEGEKNFVAFLYYYQLCIGTNEKDDRGKKKKILVIDDPVSSMDSQVLFIVSTLIQNLALYKWQKGNQNDWKKEYKNPNIEQIIILTHNFYFYKEVSLEKRPTNTDFSHYLIKKTTESTIENKERLRIATDDYTLMWRTLKDIKNNLKSGVNNIVIANLMRRIIDSFVGFLGLGSDCWGAIDEEELNKSSNTYFIKSAFLSSINDDSHKVSALDAIYYQKISQVEPQVLFDVFEQIFNTIGKEHYSIMMRDA